jgi:hypothetical protein
MAQAHGSFFLISTIWLSNLQKQSHWTGVFFASVPPTLKWFLDLASLIHSNESKYIRIPSEQPGNLAFPGFHSFPFLLPFLSSFFSIAFPPTWMIGDMCQNAIEHLLNSYGLIPLYFESAMSSLDSPFSRGLKETTVAHRTGGISRITRW